VRAQVLDFAVELVSRQGLTVGLGHLSFDEIIQTAGVSRTTAYRVWPRKERFLEDLLRRLADVTSPCYGPLDDESSEVGFAVLNGHIDKLGTSAGRKMVLVEVARTISTHWREGASASPKWRTYLALIATMRSLGNEELADDLCSRLQAVDNAAVEHLAALYQQALTVLGYRVRDLSMSQLVHTCGATLMGAMLLAEHRPEMTVPVINIDPFDTGRSADWALASIAYTATLLAAIEPDPDYNLEAALSSLN